MPDKTFKLCEDCDKCPVVKIRQDEFHITDDFGGYVVLTKKEIDVLIKNIQNP